MINIEAIGTVGKDAIIKNIGGSEKILFNIVVNKKFIGDDGEEKESVLWVSVICNRNKFKEIESDIKIGTPVYVSGDFRVNIYKGKLWLKVGVTCYAREINILSRLTDGTQSVIF